MVVNAMPCAMPAPKPWMPRNTINCVMVCGRAAERAAGHEDGDAGQQERLAAVHVGELADDRHDDRRRQHVGGGDGRVVLEALQVGDHARHRGADDGAVERREQHHRHDADGAHQDDTGRQFFESSSLRGLLLQSARHARARRCPAAPRGRARRPRVRTSGTSCQHVDEDRPPGLQQRFMQRQHLRRRPHADDAAIGRVGLAARQLERDESIDEGRDR